MPGWHWRHRPSHVEQLPTSRHERCACGKWRISWLHHGLVVWRSAWCDRHEQAQTQRRVWASDAVLRSRR